jgi:hypothetical protein
MKQPWGEGNFIICDSGGVYIYFQNYQNTHLIMRSFHAYKSHCKERLKPLRYLL